MRCAIVTALILLTVSSAAGFQEPEGFRGIRWGMSPEQAKDVIRAQWKERGVSFDRYGFASSQSHTLIREIEPKTGLYGPAKIGGRHGEFLFRDFIGSAIVDIHVWFLDDKFAQAELRFKSAFFPTLETAFKERYGTPTLEEEKEVQNRMGAKFLNKEVTWTGPNVLIRIDKYFGTLNDGRATISQREYVEYILKEQKDRSKGAAKDL